MLIYVPVRVKVVKRKKCKFCELHYFYGIFFVPGESIPVSKTPLPHTDHTMPWKLHSGEDFKRHVLFCGTEVIQTKSTGHGQVKAVVLRTGK